MVINKNASKTYKFFASSSCDLAYACAFIIYRKHPVRKLVNNTCYFHKKHL